MQTINGHDFQEIAGIEDGLIHYFEQCRKCKEDLAKVEQSNTPTVERVG